MLRQDDLENGYRLWQDPEAFCFGIDAVLLAHFGKLRRGDRVLDFCTGNGVIPHLLAADARDQGISISVTGIELQKEAAELARRSVRDNCLEDIITIEEGDVREASKRFGPASFDLITCNPPYLKPDGGLKNASGARTIARHEVSLTLSEAVREAAVLLKMHGRLWMVHRPFRLAELLHLLVEHRLEPKRLRLVCPAEGKEPSMVLVEAVKGAKSGLIVMPSLPVYGPEGKYTEEVLRIYGKRQAP